MLEFQIAVGVALVFCGLNSIVTNRRVSKLKRQVFWLDSLTDYLLEKQREAKPRV